MKKLIFGLLLSITAVTNIQAKEIELTIENKQSTHPISVHYTFSNKSHLYGNGEIKDIKINEKYFVYVNRVPDDENLMVQLDKITVGKRTAINDPCEIKLSKNNLKANIVVGFEGDPETHGKITCFISSTEELLK